MDIILANSQNATKALYIVGHLQKRFVDKLNTLSLTLGENRPFEEISWLRDEGLHGGGNRFEFRDTTLFNTGSVNVSQVHYDELPEKNLKSATAISTIIHPQNPHVPSVHIHISLTELRDGSSYWRLMADLNPSIVYEEDTLKFTNDMKKVAGDTFKEGVTQGDKYFNIPALKRTRGVSHFYLENYKGGQEVNDFAFAQLFGEQVIDSYVEIIENAIQTRVKISKEDKNLQLAYHTLYLFQVLTLDRGTTSGLMVHSQNDIGIMGSLPAKVNRELLLSWVRTVPSPQDKLVKSLVDCLDIDGIVDEKVKAKLANAVREHYKQYPEALNMQASGNTIPATVNNHSQKL
jgi:coproporphyrinogen III oxidase